MPFTANRNNTKIDQLLARMEAIESNKPEVQAAQNICDRHSLQKHIKDSLGYEIPDKPICNGHSAPLDFIFESYTQKVLNCIVIADRNGGKTLNSAILEWLEFERGGIEIAHLGAIMAQAKRAYSYIMPWALQNKTRLKIDKITMEKTHRSDGSQIEVLPGTFAAVNGPHPQKTAMDEFELLAWEIFQEACSMPKSNDFYAAAQRLLTTRKFPSGNAQKMIEEAPNRGYKVYIWCIFEVMTKCDCKTPGKCDKKYNKYVSYDRDGNPVTWPSICQGKAQKCEGYYDFKDVLEKFLTLDFETFDAQWLCNRPERSDVAFPEFHYERNVIGTWDLKKDDGWKFGRGWDYGLDDPTAISFYNYQEDGECIKFHEIVKSGKLIEDIAAEVRRFSDKIAPPEKWADWGDPSGNNRSAAAGGSIARSSYVAKLRESKIRVKSKTAKTIVMDGIQAVKRMLRPHNLTGLPRFYVVAGLKHTINAYQYSQWDRTRGDNAHSKEKYRHDEHSHILDSDRYFFNGVYPIKQEKIQWG